MPLMDAIKRKSPTLRERGGERLIYGMVKKERLVNGGVGNDSNRADSAIAIRTIRIEFPLL